jgi:hypothetical protein
MLTGLRKWPGPELALGSGTTAKNAGKAFPVKRLKACQTTNCRLGQGGPARRMCWGPAIYSQDIGIGYTGRALTP